MVDGQFFADYLKVLTKQTIVIERANEVFHHIALLFCHIDLAHLLF